MLSSQREAVWLCGTAALLSLGWLAVERRQAAVQGDEGKTNTHVFDLILGLG
jgi:hypothetical protein